jgi:sugar lactone lactonase YvrE
LHNFDTGFRKSTSGIYRLAGWHASTPANAKADMSFEAASEVLMATSLSVEVKARFSFDVPVYITAANITSDGNVYVWHRNTGALLEVLAGHGQGSVNSVAWNPRNERMFASCSDDHTIRIWETPPPDMAIDDSPIQRPAHLLPFIENGNVKGKTRQRMDGSDLHF